MPGRIAVSGVLPSIFLQGSGFGVQRHFGESFCSIQRYSWNRELTPHFW